MTFSLLCFVWFNWLLGNAECVLIDDWTQCCSWGTWEAWGICESECNGIRSRSRELLYFDNPLCTPICHIPDYRSDTARCNEFCFNGGLSDGFSCSCVLGFYGECCRSLVNCGNPGPIANGILTGGTYTYNSIVTYICQSEYILVDGLSSRICQSDATWSGIKPRCAFYNSCASGPCKNGAICTNTVDNYQCSCSSGWTGKMCDVDIQPPEMKSCPNNKYITTSALTGLVEWQIPTFVDPHNFAMQVTANYPSNKFTFPWGDFNVSYTAVKPTNGLSTNCLFSISLRPNPCPPISVPVNGALLCNNWRTDYGQFCTFVCKETYTVVRGAVLKDFYVCGATGSWTPTNNIPNCSVTVKNLHITSSSSIGSTYSSCSTDRRVMQQYYINKLRQSDFSYFCKKFEQECIAENVSVQC